MSSYSSASSLPLVLGTWHRPASSVPLVVGEAIRKWAVTHGAVQHWKVMPVCPSHNRKDQPGWTIMTNGRKQVF